MRETEEIEHNIADILTPKQELFCRFYTQNYDTFGNATLSYAEAYDYDLENMPKDDSRWVLQDGREVLKRELEYLTNKEKDGNKKIEDSTYDKAYNYCSRAGSRIRRNGKVQERCRVLTNEFMRDDVIDTRLTEIMLKGKDTDSIAAIKEYNKLKQRIIEKKDITSNGETITGFNFILPEETNDKDNADNTAHRETSGGLEAPVI